MKKHKKDKAPRKIVDMSNPEPLDIPEDEIWTYRIEGLQEPRIGGTYQHPTGKKVLTVAVLLVAIGLSIFFSVRAVHNDTFKYKMLEDGTYELVKFTNPGDMTALTINCVDNDPQKPITVLHEYFLNCDDKLQTVTIGENIREIDGKSFYSCWNLQAIFVDENNPSFCDVDGVLYTKDLKRLICYPIDRDRYLRDQAGYEQELTAEDAAYDEAYIRAVQTYRLPEQTETIGMLALNYADLVDVYIPQGLKTIETMAFFKCEKLRNLYSFDGATVYPSLPDGLETIGSDAFSYDQALTYMYIPSSVTSIGHHAFWDTVYKKDGELLGVTALHAEADEDTFKANTQTGDQWRAEYDYMLFKKPVDILYSAQRESAS